MDCLFCKIVDKEIEAKIIYEDESSMSFLDINPRAPGHAMIISKVHSENLLDLPEKEVGPLFLAVRKTMNKILGVLSPDGFTVGINHGDVAGQSVKHLHVHVVPRFENDGGGSLHSVVNNPGDEDLDSLAQKISSA